MVLMTVIPKVNKLIIEKRGKRFAFLNSLVFFSLSTIFMPIISLVVLSDEEAFIKGYAGALNDD